MRILGLSDPLTMPTGFGRVARELFIRLAEQGHEVGYLSRWTGTKKFPGIQKYCADLYDEVCAGAFPVAANDFGTPFILWTLLDPWQTGWISHSDMNTYATNSSKAWWSENRAKVRWVGHYPVDGEGIGGHAPFWYEQFLNGPDVTVFMSEFGERLLKPDLTTRTRFISHAVDTDLFYPISNEDKEKIKEAAGLAGKRVIISVMANRYRKYWPELLQAFKIAHDQEPDLHFMGVCGDPRGDTEGSWSLAEIAHRLGLLGDKPCVSFISAVSDKALARMFQVSEQAALLSAGEGFGLPQLEAHACGIPCIVGRYSASEELMVDEHEGVSPRAWTFQGNNVIRRPVYAWPDVADKILYWSRNEDRRRMAGVLGWEQARKRTWANILPQWLALFEELWAELQEPPEPAEPVKEETVVAGPAQEPSL